MIVLKTDIQQGMKKQSFRHFGHFSLTRASLPAFFVTNFARKGESIDSRLSYNTKKTSFQMKMYQIVAFGIDIDTKFRLWIACIVDITENVWNKDSRSKFIAEYARFKIVGILVLSNICANKMS